MKLFVHKLSIEKCAKAKPCFLFAKHQLNESGKEKEAEKDGKIGETEVQKQPIIERIRNYSFSVDDLAIIGGILVFLLLVAIICIFTFSGNPALKEPPLRDGKYIRAVTSCGPVEGVVEDSSYAFRGIPYAVCLYSIEIGRSFVYLSTV